MPYFSIQLPKKILNLTGSPTRMITAGRKRIPGSLIWTMTATETAAMMTLTVMGSRMKRIPVLGMPQSQQQENVRYDSL